MTTPREQKEVCPRCGGCGEEYAGEPTTSCHVCGGDGEVIIPRDPAEVTAEKIREIIAKSCSTAWIEPLVREVFAEQTAEVERLRGLLKELMTTIPDTDEWGALMAVIHDEVRDEIEAAEAAKGKAAGNER